VSWSNDINQRLAKGK